MNVKADSVRARGHLGVNAETVVELFYELQEIVCFHPSPAGFEFDFVFVFDARGHARSNLANNLSIASKASLRFSCAAAVVIF